jgi:hypothetical protein
MHKYLSSCRSTGQYVLSFLARHSLISFRNIHYLKYSPLKQTLNNNSLCQFMVANNGWPHRFSGSAAFINGSLRPVVCCL